MFFEEKRDVLLLPEPKKPGVKARLVLPASRVAVALTLGAVLAAVAVVVAASARRTGCQSALVGRSSPQ